MENYKNIKSEHQLRFLVFDDYFIGKLREKMKVLAKKIEPKVYEYGFLLE
jgi:hypothetical protein